jgi:hypothetical protein
VAGLAAVFGLAGVSAVFGLAGVSAVFGLAGVSAVFGLAGVSAVLGLAGVSAVLGLAGVYSLAAVFGLAGVFGVAGLAGAAAAFGLAGVFGVAGLAGGVDVAIIRERAAESMARSESRTSLAASPSGMKLSSLVTRETWPRNPPSASAVMIPSDTPPVRRVSSAISTRPVALDSRRMSSAGNGAIQRRSTTRQLMPCLRSRAAARRLIRSPLPKVIMVRSLPSLES